MKKNITIIILTMLVIGLSGYIAYDKLLSQKDKVENQEKENKVENSNIQEGNNDVQEENKVTWLDYLLEQEFVSASLSVCSIDGKFVYGKDSDWQPNPGTGRDITKEELKKILTTIYESKKENNPFGEIVKSYGYAAPACEEAIHYKYNHDGKEQEFILAASTLIVTEDEDFIKVLNNHMKEYTNYAINKVDTNYNNLVKDMMKDYIRY